MTPSYTVHAHAPAKVGLETDSNFYDQLYKEATGVAMAVEQGKGHIELAMDVLASTPHAAEKVAHGYITNANTNDYVDQDRISFYSHMSGCTEECFEEAKYGPTRT